MDRLKFEIMKRMKSESRISQRSWLEQKTRNRIAKAINSWDEDKEKKFRIKYIAQKLDWRAKESLNKADLDLILSLSDEELKLLPWSPTQDNKYFYCAEKFLDKNLDVETWKWLKGKAVGYVYKLLKDAIEEDIVFSKNISVNTALKYLSQHELADILTYNTNFWTHPYWQLDTLAKRFDVLPSLDPLEYAKKFEAQVGIRGRVYSYGRDPIEILISNCKRITPEFEAYLVEKWYEKELKERKEKDQQTPDTLEDHISSQISDEQWLDSWLTELVWKDKEEREREVGKLKEMLRMFKEVNEKWKY
jgi:hypothetical protein